MSPSQAGPQDADALVIFGITGDLAKKMTLRSLYRLEARGLLDCPIIGVAVDDWTIERLREHADEAIAATGEHVDPQVFARLAERLSYVSGDFADPETFERVATALGGARVPGLLPRDPAVAVRDGRRGPRRRRRCCRRGARVVVEKPFGHDLASARELAAELHAAPRRDAALPDRPLPRARWGSQEFLYLRFANTMLEPVWNRSHVASVQITMAEEFGVEDRGHFYDPVGALRDVVVNHLLQLLAAVAQEPPAAADAATLKDAKYAVLALDRPTPTRRTTCAASTAATARSTASRRARRTETYAALRLEIDNWRWAGVPFFIRTGKRLPVTQTEVRLVFRHPPRLGFVSRAPPPPGARPARRAARPPTSASS